MNQKRKCNIRRTDRRRLRRYIAEGKVLPICAFCDQRVIFVADVPVADRVRVTDTHLTFMRDGLMLTMPIGTVEHKTGLHNRGDIVPCCAQCNIDRNHAKLQEKYRARQKGRRKR